MIENFTIGITSGLVVTLFVVVFRNLWIAVITPWIEDRVYKDAKIEGKWFGLFPNQANLRQEVISLKRHGHEVSGKLICTEGGDEGEEYILKGSFRNLILTLTYESTNESSTDRGTYTLQCIRSGERLSGFLSTYNGLRDKIEPCSIVWFRTKDDLESFISKIEKRKDEIRALETSRKEILQKEIEIEDSEEPSED
jgi:hypothetical protein